MSPPSSSNTVTLFKKAHSAYANFYERKHNYYRESPYYIRHRDFSHPISPRSHIERTKNDPHLTNKKYSEHVRLKDKSIATYSPYEDRDKKHKRFNQSINPRLNIPPTLINQILYSDSKVRPQEYESKSLRVLFVMFPEVDEDTIREVLHECEYEIQIAVDHLLSNERVSHKAYETLKKVAATSNKEVATIHSEAN